MILSRWNTNDLFSHDAFWYGQAHQNKSIEVVAADEPVEGQDEEVESQNGTVFDGNVEVLLISFLDDTEKIYFLPMSTIQQLQIFSCLIRRLSFMYWTRLA